jgi:hypothetical protein
MFGSGCKTYLSAIPNPQISLALTTLLLPTRGSNGAKRHPLSKPLARGRARASPSGAEPLANQRITGRDYETGAFQSHLAKWTEPRRGPILKQTGSRRNYRWQFLNPQLIPYIRLHGIKTGLLPEY